MNRRGLLPFALLLALAPTARAQPCASAVSLSPLKREPTAANAPVDTVLGDVTGDGHIDIVTVDATPLIAVSPGRGDGTFGPPFTLNTIGLFTNPTAIALEDLDNDGDLDYIIGAAMTNRFGFPAGGITVPNRGDGLRDPAGRVNVFDGVDPGQSIVTTPVNEDARPDIILGYTDSANEGGWQFFISDSGDRYFSLGARTRLPALAELHLADLNNDGVRDLLATFRNADPRWYIGSDFPNFFFQLEDPAATDAAAPRGSAVADLDGDNTVDLLVATDSQVRYFLGNGDGTFTFRTAALEGGNAIRHIAAADLNGDGRDDLVVTRNDNTLSIRLTGPNAIPGGSTIVASGGPALGTLLADLDHDQDPDLVTTLTTLPTAHAVRLNDCNSAPVFTIHPISQTVDPGTTVQLIATLATGHDTVAFQWSRNGTPLADDARVTGALTDTLTITGASTADSDTYTLTATNFTGTATTPPAVLAVRAPACAADLNNNGMADIFDIIDFLNIWNAACP